MFFQPGGGYEKKPDGKEGIECQFPLPGSFELLAHVLWLTSDQRLTVDISETASNDHNEINKRPDAATAQGKQHRKTGAGFPDIEAMNAEGAEEKTKQ